MLSAAGDPYKESEKGFVLWFSPEAGLRVPVQLPGHSSNQKLSLKGLLNKKAGWVWHSDTAAHIFLSSDGNIQQHSMLFGRV